MSKTNKPESRSIITIRDGVVVRLVGKHPHLGATGTIRGTVYTSDIFPDWRMWKVVLDGGEECFASAEDMMRYERRA